MKIYKLFNVIAFGEGDYNLNICAIGMTNFYPCHLDKKIQNLLDFIYNEIYVPYITQIYFFSIILSVPGESWNIQQKLYSGEFLVKGKPLIFSWARTLTSNKEKVKNIKIPV